MSNLSRTLYTGVTNNLERRVYQHKNELMEGFTRKYKIKRLVYFEETTSIEAAIAREKQIKAWRRQKKITLIKKNNPAWADLSEEWITEAGKAEPRSALDDTDGCHSEERAGGGRRGICL
ncbi:MAG TPA: GIY-YIG nuclease family protein [Actinobacteria bacterium]|nr:GIY-YIG nuclease family protein [Actinomycetota bacterium]